MEAVKKKKAYIYICSAILLPFFSPSFVSINFIVESVSVCVPGLRSYTYKYTLFFFFSLVTAKYCVG